MSSHVTTLYFSLQAISVLFGHFLQIASMVAVAPNALLDDGLLDCVYLTGTPVQQV